MLFFRMVCLLAFISIVWFFMFTVFVLPVLRCLISKVGIHIFVVFLLALPIAIVFSIIVLKRT